MSRPIRVFLFCLVSLCFSSTFAGSNQTLFGLLHVTGFASVYVSPITTITVANVYCEENSATDVKCTATQDSQMLEIIDSPLFLSSLRGGAAALTYKSIYTLKQLACSRRDNSNGSPALYTCNVTP